MKLIFTLKLLIWSSNIDSSCSFVCIYLHSEGDSTNNQLLAHAKYVHFIHNKLMHFDNIIHIKILSQNKLLINLTIIKSNRLKKFDKWLVHEKWYN